MKSVFALALVLTVSGCGGGSTSTEPRTFDLGLAAPSAAFPAVRIASVRAVVPFEATDMQYRLAYRNASEIAAFASSRWAAPPAELLRKQLLRTAHEKQGKCALDIEIQEFTQVFSAKDASEARIEVRAALSNGPARIASRGIALSEPGAGADAASGAAAMARAADRLMQELAAWVSNQAACA